MNIPVAQLPDEIIRSHEIAEFFGARYALPIAVDWPGTVVAVNVGGAVIPVVISIYLLSCNRIWLSTPRRPRSSRGSFISWRADPGRRRERVASPSMTRFCISPRRSHMRPG